MKKHTLEREQTFLLVKVWHQWMSPLPRLSEAEG